VLMDDVQLLRWPSESTQLDRCRKLGVPRLLVVEGQLEPPMSADVREDWVRPPVSRSDLLARAATLRARVDQHSAPQVDPSGVVRYGPRSVPTSPIETVLVGRLARHFGSVVTREELQHCLDKPPDGSRNALDLHVTRLRRRLAPLGLVIRTAWRRGYLLEAKPAAGEPPGDPSVAVPGPGAVGTAASRRWDRALTSS